MERLPNLHEESTEIAIAPRGRDRWEFCLEETLRLGPDEIRTSRHTGLVHHYEDWGTVRAHLIRRTGLHHQETRVAVPRYTLLMNLKGAALHGENFVAGRRVPFTVRRSGSIIYIPAGTEWTGWDQGDAIASYLHVSIDKKFVEQTFGHVFCRRLTEMAPLIGLRNAALEVALQRIAVEVRSSDAVSAMLVESQAVFLLAQLFRSIRMPGKRSEGGLSSFDLKRAIEMLEAYSDRSPSLAELADEIGLCRFHFCRAFKQSTGLTPHAFRAKRRLEQAALMLRSTDLSATEIALACGFGSSSHFTTAFKRVFETCPTEFRRKSRL